MFALSLLTLSLGQTLSVNTSPFKFLIDSFIQIYLNNNNLYQMIHYYDGKRYFNQKTSITLNDSHFYEKYLYLQIDSQLYYNQIMQNSKTTQNQSPTPKDTPASKLKQEMKRYMQSIDSNQDPKNDHQNEQSRRDRQELSRSRQKKYKKNHKYKNQQKYEADQIPKNNKLNRQSQKDNNSSGSDRPTVTKSSYDRQKKVPNTGAEKFYKTRLCPQFLDGNCQRGIKCTYAHGSSQLRQCNASFKTQLCHRFARGGCQKPREQCKYAHGQSDLRSNNHNSKSNQRKINIDNQNRGYIYSSLNFKKDNRQHRKQQGLRSNNDYNRAYQFSPIPPPVKPQFQPGPNSIEKRQQINNLQDNWTNNRSRFDEPLRQRPIFYPNNFNPLPYVRDIKYLPNPSSTNQTYEINPTPPAPIYGAIPYYQGYPTVYDPIQPPHSYQHHPLNNQIQNNLTNQNQGSFELKPPTSNFDNKQTLKFDNNVVCPAEVKLPNPNYQGFQGGHLYGNVYAPNQAYPPNYNNLYPPIPYPPYGYDYMAYNFGGPQGYGAPVKNDKNNLTLRSDSSSNGGQNVGGRVISNRNGSFEQKQPQSVLKGEKPQLLH